MPEWVQWALIAAGVAAILLLLVFIQRQWHLLRTRRRQQEKSREFREQRREKMIESIRIIAMAVEQDQVEYSEACLRFKGLLDHVAPELLDQEPFTVFQTVHDLIQHMPTHRARKNTDARFLEKLDRERRAVEQDHAEAIRRAAKAIRQHPF